MTSYAILLSEYPVKNLNVNKFKDFIEKSYKVVQIKIDDKKVDKVTDYKEYISFEINLLGGSNIQLKKDDTLAFICDDNAFLSDFLKNNSRTINQIFDLIIDIMNEFHIKFFIGNIGEMNVFTIKEDGSYDFWGIVEVILSKTDYYLDILQMFIKQRTGKKVSKEEIQKVLVKHNCITKEKGVYIINLLYKTKDIIDKTRDVLGNRIRDKYQYPIKN